MKFDLEKIIIELSRELKLPKKEIKKYINGNLGTRWIFEKGLNCSEVELSMVLKNIRKRLSFDFRYDFNQNVQSKAKIATLKKIFAKYRKFYHTHLIYFQKGKALKDIEKILHKNSLIIDSEISHDRFFHLLPDILIKISPAEMHLCFTINTLLRWNIANHLQLQIDDNLFVRGSLIFFNSRSFGCGFLANFPQENYSLQKKTTYLPAQGSDLDIRIESLTSIKKVHLQLQDKISDLQLQLLKYNSFLTVEITNITRETVDDLLPIKYFFTKIYKITDCNFLSEKDKTKSVDEVIAEKKLLPLKIKKIIWEQFIRLDKNPPKNFPNMNLSNIVLLQKELFYYLSRFDLTCATIKEIILSIIISLKLYRINHRIRLTKENIKILVFALENIFRYYKANDDIINNFLFKWEGLLEKTKRETDFYGFISRKYLFNIFENLFFLTGYRFSNIEKEEIFKKLMQYYEAEI